MAKFNVTADMRESRSGLTQRLERSEIISLNYADLPVGDFVLSESVVIERKEASDLVLSIMDKRLFGQIAQMKATFARPIVLIEGNIFKTNSNISHDALRGALSWMTVIEGVNLMYSSGVEESASLIEVMARHAQDGLGYAISLRAGKPKDLGILAHYAIEGMPGCGPGTAKKLLAHFGSVESVLLASVEQLCEVKGVGRKTADQIRELITFKTN